VANNKKKKSESSEDEASPKIIANESIDINELFANLKEFENKVLLDRLKTIERSIISIQKDMLLDRSILRDIKQVVACFVCLSLAHEELLNNVKFSEYREGEEEPESNTVAEKGNKKWN